MSDVSMTHVSSGDPSMGPGRPGSPRDGFEDEPGYGTPPHPGWPWLTGIFEEGMREKAIAEVGEQNR